MKDVSLPVKRAIRQIGMDIRDARRRRLLTAAIVAERASITRPTLLRIERGDPGVSLGHYASVLFALNLADRLGALADPGVDEIGRQLEEEKLPLRVRTPRTGKK